MNDRVLKSWEVRETNADCKACGDKDVPCIGVSIDYQYGVTGVRSWLTLCLPCMDLLDAFRAAQVPVLRDYFPPYNELPAITYSHVNKWADDWM